MWLGGYAVVNRMTLVLGEHHIGNQTFLHPNHNGLYTDYENFVSKKS
jgi:hypothetical protein